MFNSLSDRITGSLRNLSKAGRLSEKDVEAVISDIRRALLDADVALPVVRQFTASVREKAVGAVASQALNPAQQVVKIVNDELIEVLGGETRELNWATKPPTVIMLAGLQGAGKTTLAGKLGRWLRENGHRPLLVASDLQRPNAVQQLQVWASRRAFTCGHPSRATAWVIRLRWRARPSSTRRKTRSTSSWLIPQAASVLTKR